MEFDGCVCIVTGGASGIGEEIARTFGARGATVAIADVQLEKAEQVAAAITGAGPGTASASAAICGRCRRSQPRWRPSTTASGASTCW